MTDSNQLSEEALLDLDADAPPEFLCPITMSIMKDPVILPDGQTYERSAIEHALQANPISPLTRQPMTISEAKPNYALKSLIEKYIQDHKHEVTDTQTASDVKQLTSKIPIEPLNEVEIESFTGSFLDNNLLISVKPKNINGRLPVSIIAMIDISGSMEAEVTEATSGVEDTQLSRIQLVQFSLQTILSVLGEHDTITLIVFNNKSQLVLPETYLNEEGKQKANLAINNFYPTGATNIWSALDMGIDEAVKQYQQRRKDEKSLVNTSLLLFTDGEPNVNPPMGILPSLDDKLEENPITFTMSTFGFGYSIDSNLLYAIAQKGNGIYGYCPDATMVGTIFINYLSNLISMVSPLSVLDADLDGTHTSYQLSLYNGATSNVMIPIAENKQASDYKISLSITLTHQNIQLSSIQPISEDQKAEFRNQKYRKMLIDILLKNSSEQANIEQGFEEVKHLFDLLTNETNRTPFMNNLMIDLMNDDTKHGQIGKAYDKNYYMKWGRDYLFSLLRFHILEQCGNFKDMSLQLYGNETFRSFRKVANKIFMNLPLPEARTRSRPSSRRIHRHVGHQHNVQETRNYSMRSIHSRSAGCFNGDALVDLQNGIQRKVIDLKKGDILSTGQKIECVVKIATKDGCSDAVKIGEAYFSPYHPIKVLVDNEREKRWVFPVDVGTTENIKIDYWYNLVLEKQVNDHVNNATQITGGTVIVGGIEAVTLGHGITEGVCKHPYFGTEKVIEALQKHQDYAKGFLQFTVPPIAKRDPITDMIIEYY